MNKLDNHYLQWLASVIGKPRDFPKKIAVVYCEDVDPLLNWVGEKVIGKHLYSVVRSSKQTEKLCKNLAGPHLLIYFPDADENNLTETMEKMIPLMTRRERLVHIDGVEMGIKTQYSHFVIGVKKKESLNYFRGDDRFLIVNEEKIDKEKTNKLVVSSTDEMANIFMTYLLSFAK